MGKLASGTTAVASKGASPASNYSMALVPAACLLLSWVVISIVQQRLGELLFHALALVGVGLRMVLVHNHHAIHSRVTRDISRAGLGLLLALLSLLGVLFGHDLPTSDTFLEVTPWDATYVVQLVVSCTTSLPVLIGWVGQGSTLLWQVSAGFVYIGVWVLAALVIRPVDSDMVDDVLLTGALGIVVTACLIYRDHVKSLTALDRVQRLSTIELGTNIVAPIPDAPTTAKASNESAFINDSALQVEETKSIEEGRGSGRRPKPLNLSWTAAHSKSRAKLIDPGANPVLKQCIDMLSSLKSKSTVNTARQITYALRLLQSTHVTNPTSVRRDLTHASRDGSIDATTANWVESTLQLNDSRDRSMPMPSPAPTLHKRLSTRSSTADILSSLNSSLVVGLVADVLNWEFSIFELVKHCPKRYLGLIAGEVFEQYNLFEEFNLEAEHFTKFMDTVEVNYCYDPTNPNDYHNALHSADVLQAVGVFCQEPRVNGCLNQLELAALFFASIIHDYRHPGVSNNFLITSQSTLALRYNDDSVLENFHAASGFELLSTIEHSPFAPFTPGNYKLFRKMVIRCVLATDLAKGNANISEFTQKVLLPLQAATNNKGAGSSESTHSESETEPSMAVLALDPDSALVLMQMVLKCADVSHPTRKMEQHLKWSNMITREFYAQGDLEVAAGMKVSPLCDRNNHNLNKSQAGFIDFIVRPAFATFCEYLGNDLWLTILERNYQTWKNEEIKSSADDFAARTNPKFHGSLRLIPTSNPRRASLPTLQLTPSDTLMTRFSGRQRHTPGGRAPVHPNFNVAAHNLTTASTQQLLAVANRNAMLSSVSSMNSMNSDNDAAYRLSVPPPDPDVFTPTASDAMNAESPAFYVHTNSQLATIIDGGGDELDLPEMSAEV